MIGSGRECSAITVQSRRFSKSHCQVNPIRLPSYKPVGRFFLVSMVAIHLFFLWAIRDRIALGDPDFTVFYTAAKMLRAGQGTHLYDPVAEQAIQRRFTSDPDLRQGPLPYIHPPFEALLFVPLTLFPYSDAFWIWNITNLGLLSIVAGLLRNFVPPQITFWDALLALMAFFPVFANFHQGQDAILLLFLVVLGYRAFASGHDFAAGCWWGLGIFKYHLILPLILILVCWRGMKLLSGFLTTGSLAALLSLFLVGWRGAISYFGYVWHVISIPGYGRIPFRQLPNLAGLVAGWTASGNENPALRLAVLATSIALLLAVICLRTTERGPFLELKFSCAVIAAVLVGYSTNTYDLSLLALPLALIVNSYLREKSPPNILLPAIPLMISPLWFFLWMRWERINLIALCLLWWLLAIEHEILRKRNAGGARVEPALASHA